jgi:hypothetical protein
MVCCYARMKRITIAVDDSLSQVAEQEALRLRVSVSEVFRRALKAMVVPKSAGKLPFEALGKSGARSTAREVDTILAKEWSSARRR